MRRAWSREQLKAAAYRGALQLGCTCYPRICAHGLRLEIYHADYCQITEMRCVQLVWNHLPCTRIR
jgi:hypothetical protein